MARDFTEEEKELLRRLMSELGEPPSRFGPINDPLRFNHLPQHTRTWLEGKSEAELKKLDKIIESFDTNKLEELQDTMKLTRELKAFGKYTRIIIVTFVSVFISAVLFGEKIAVAWKWMTGAAK